jgi:hypothetical protein
MDFIVGFTLYEEISERTRQVFFAITLISLGATSAQDWHLIQGAFNSSNSSPDAFDNSNTENFSKRFNAQSG